MEQLKTMKETLMGQVQGQMGNLQNVDAKELGEAIDMIADLSKAIYYCTITEAMEGKDKEQNMMRSINYYTYPIDPYLTYDYDRDMDKYRGRMYYSESGNSSGRGSMGGYGNNSNGNGRSGGRNYTEYPTYMNYERDTREGRSPMMRRNYMESKEMHQSKEVQMKELDKYMQELSHDITEMIEDASPEEKQILQKKIAALATKIN